MFRQLLMASALFVMTPLATAQGQVDPRVVRFCESQASLALDAVNARYRGVSEAEAKSVIVGDAQVIVDIIEGAFRLPLVQGSDNQRYQATQYHNDVLMDCLGI